MEEYLSYWKIKEITSKYGLQISLGAVVLLIAVGMMKSQHKGTFRFLPWTCFLISAGANIVLVWYIKKLFKDELGPVTEDFDTLGEYLRKYAEFLETLGKKDIYLADSTFEQLLKYTRSVVKMVTDYRMGFEIYKDDEDMEDIGNDMSDEEGNE